MAKKKIQLQDANGNVLHPLTLGECVAMDNGENLDTLMSKSQMFTPTITQDKSMFKVGTGVDVDYSANVKDGAYESLVFKGKSLVNLLTCLRPDTHSAWVRNGSSFTLNASGVLFLNYDALLKPNTTYTVVGELDFDVDGIVIGFREGNKSWEVNRSIDSRGRFAVLISTSAESTSNALTVHRKVTSNSDRVALSNLMVLEGDWTNTELPPYFEGLGSCKMPILRNMGKNLIPLPLIANTGLTWVDGVEHKPSSDYSFTSTGFIKIQTGVYYTSSNTSNMGKRVHCYDEGKRHLGVLKTDGSIVNSAANVCTSHTFKIDDKNVCYIRLTFYGVLEAAQLEESSTATSYEDHKTNILRTSEEIVLREVGGVQDTYNPLTGEYVQRIGEIILDGSENWQERTDLGWTTHQAFYYKITDKKKGGVFICDKAPVRTSVSAEQGEGIHDTRWGGGYIFYDIPSSKLSTPNVAGFKAFLQSNPITVQYELAEPITTIIKPSTMTPFAYQNGHVIVESGFEGQSLLPEIEYSVVTGRTGQVTQNTKVLRQQEQQIIGLEELLLTQVVQMEYERTLLQFDYELQMMMLG